MHPRISHFTKSKPVPAEIMTIKHFFDASLNSGILPNSKIISSKQSEILEDKINKSYFSLKVQKSIANIYASFNFPKTTKKDLTENSSFILAHTCISEKQNVCFFGFGSKITSVKDFVHSNFADKHIIISVNGSDSKNTLENVIIKMIYKLQTTFPEPEKIQIQINQKNEKKLKTLDTFLGILDKLKQRVLFFMTNIDGPNFFKKEILTELSIIANHPLVTFIATIDDLNFPLLLTTKNTSQFNFMFLPLHTFEFYEKEIAYLESRNVGKLGQSIETIFGILESFTPDQRLIY